VEQLVADRAGGAPGAALRALAARAEGNPALLVALVDGLRHEDRLRDHGPFVDAEGSSLPAGLGAAVAARLAALGADAAQVARVTAALGPACRVAQIGRMLGRTAAQLMGPIDQAIRADLLVDDDGLLRFRSELVREALLRSLPTSVRRGLRRQAAEVLLAGGVRGADIAEQLADGAEAGDAVAAAHILDAAVELARVDGDRAAELARRAVDVCPPGASARPRLVARSIRLLAAADRQAEAEELGLRTLDGPLAVADEAEVRLSLSTLDEQTWSLERAQHNLRALRACAPAPGAQARHLAWLAHNLAAGGRREAVPAAVERAMRAATAAGDRTAIGVAALARAVAAARAGDHAAIVPGLSTLPRLGATSDELECACRAALLRATALGALGRVADGSAMADERLAGARRTRRRRDVDRWQAVQALLALMAGRLDDARDAASAVRAHAATPAAETARLALMMVARHRGDRAAVRELADAVVGGHQEPAPGSLSAARRRWLRALAAGVLGEPAEAADAVRAALADAPADPWWHVDAARVAVAAGDAELGGELVGAVAWTVERDGRAPAAIARHVQGLVAHDADLLGQAVELARGGERPLVLAAALEDHGAALTGAAAVERLEEARSLFAEAGARGDARRVAERLEQLGVRSAAAMRRDARGWGSLTSAELRVVRVVGAGATNREAASRLYLSPHTVSSHLRSAFAKLEINSRVELARMVLQHEGA
jgi:DNA-binding CsgD family transcriptional regulator